MEFRLAMAASSGPCTLVLAQPTFDNRIGVSTEACYSIDTFASFTSRANLSVSSLI